MDLDKLSEIFPTGYYPYKKFKTGWVEKIRAQAYKDLWSAVKALNAAMMRTEGLESGWIEYCNYSPEIPPSRRAGTVYTVLLTPLE